MTDAAAASLPPLAPVPELPRRLAFLGTPAMAVPFLTALVGDGYDVAHVISRVDKRRGRGGELSPSPVKAEAIRLGVPVSHHVDDLLAMSPSVELGVVVAFGQLIKPHVLAAIPMVNVHFSLLPRWRGAAPVERALLDGDTETGTCLMQLAHGLDEGAVFDVVEYPIGPGTTGDGLRAALVELGVEQLLRCLRGGLRGATPQVGEPVYAAKLSADDYEIDWLKGIDAVDRLVRLGGAWTTFRGKRLKIHSGAPDAGRYRLDRVQPEGKPPMAAKDWANGARPALGELGLAYVG